MTELVLDLETRSVHDVKHVGAYRYAADQSTEVLCCAYALGDGPVKLWLPGKPVPPEIRRAKTFIAHNCQFERAIWHYILGPKHGWPEPKLEQWEDTMAMAAAVAWPHALENIAKALNLPMQKDKVGGKLMLRVAKPRKPRKGEDPNGIYWYEDADKYLEPTYEYCKTDTEICREIFWRVPPLSETERRVWLLDQRVNLRGFCIDQQLAQAADKIAKEAHPILNAEMLEVTEGAVTSVHQVAALKEWIAEWGLYEDMRAINDKNDLDKKDVIRFLDQGDVPDFVRRAIELRQLGAQAASKKVVKLLAYCNGDARLRGAYSYHAAATGRWASKGAQIQNLKRPQTKDIEQAISIISQGDFAQARKAFDNPLSTIGDLIRSMLCAAPGHVLIGADFSGIEARVTAWISNEKSKLQVFRNYDAGTGPDPYVSAAASIFSKLPDQIESEERQIGKACELAFGFAGGFGAFMRMAPDTKFDKDQIEAFKDAWRNAHPNIVDYWYRLWNAVWKAMRNPGLVCPCTPPPDDAGPVNWPALSLLLDDEPTLWLTLPSGRRLAYPHCRLEPEHFTYETAGGPSAARLVHPNVKKGFTGNKIIVFKDNANGQWRDVTKVWKGTFIENVVQAIARDLLAAAMLRVEAASFNIVGHVHDECIIEVRERDADKVIKKFAALMVETPDWAEGLPIVAKPWTSRRYVK